MKKIITPLLAMLLMVSFFASGCCRKEADTLKDAAEAYKEGDFRKAVLIFMPKAEDGDPEAQVNIAFMYYCGMHVERDPEMAALWYEKAAEQNNVTAQFSLGTMYENGEGVQRDLEEAYFWYSLAEKQGDSDARKLRRDLEHRLSSSQVSAAKSRTASWQPK